MDPTLLSLEQSPLAKSMDEGSSYNIFISRFGDSLGAISKHRTEIPFKSTDANTAVNFDLPAYGLVYNCYLRMTIRNNVDTTGNQVVLDTAYFSKIFDRITLLSHSREIEQLTSLSLVEHVLSQPATKKRAMKEMCDYTPAPIGGLNSNPATASETNWGAVAIDSGSDAELKTRIGTYVQQQVAAATSRYNLSSNKTSHQNPKYRYVYIPLPFNFFRGSGWQSIKDLTFLENLTLSCQFGQLFGLSANDGSQTLPTGTGATDVVNNTLLRPRDHSDIAAYAANWQFNGTGAKPYIVRENVSDGLGGEILGSALIVNYLNLPNEKMRAYQQAQFKMSNNKPLSILSGNVATESVLQNSVGSSTANGTLIQYDVPINCKNVVYQTLIAVKDTLKGGMDFEPISKIELWMSGRKIQDYKTLGDLRFENLIEHGLSHTHHNGTGINQGVEGSDNLVEKDNRSVVIGDDVRSVSAVSNQYGAHVKRLPKIIEHQENVFIMNHSIQKHELSKNMGCISFKNVSAPFLRIYHRHNHNNSARTYQYIVEHRHFQVNSVAGSDGSVNVSLSL